MRDSPRKGLLSALTCVLFVAIPAPAPIARAEPTRTELIQQLKAKSAADRRAAVVALGKLGGPSAVAPLVDCLEDKDRSVARAAAESLGKIGLPALRPLTERLHHTSAEVRRAAVQALGQLRDKQAIQPLIASLEDREGLVRGEAAGALGVLGDPEAIEPLVVCLRDEVVAVRIASASALGKLGDKRAVGGLIACLRDSEPAPRAAAVEALGRLGDPAAVGSLIPCLRDEEFAVRRAAVDALGKLGDKKAVRHLVDALPEWPLNQAIIAALKSLAWVPSTETERLYASIGGRDKEAVMMDWERNRRLLVEDARSGDRKKVENAIDTLISMGRHDVVPDLIKILDACEDPAVCEVFLSCGHPALASAGRRWATQRGYELAPGGSSSGPTWGAW